jgi:muramoyltetrapeptide carboxypeptidase
MDSGAVSDPVGREMEWVRPARLSPGDRVAVVAPSGPVDGKLLEAGLETVRDLGLRVDLGEHVGVRTGFLAGTDAQRAADLQRAWCDPDVRAVLCARGGYGAMRLLDRLDWTAMRAAGPTLLYGSSDITALHAAVGRRLGVTTVFGPMVAGVLADPAREELDHVRAALFEGPAPARGRRAYAGGRARGRLVGGNLSLLAALTGTPYAPPSARGRIAFLEDVDEAPYRVDRMLTQLLLSGWFDGVAGIVLGSWESCGPAAQTEAVLRERLGGLGVPVLAGVAAGHGRPQLTVELGAMADLDAEAGLLTPVPDATPEAAPDAVPAGT